MAAVFAICVVILAIGFVWFWIARPILEDCGVITVNTSEEIAPAVMSRSADSAPVDLPSSLQTDNRQATDRPPPTAPSRDVMLDIYRLLREHNIPREKARPVLKAAGLPLDNNLWADAAPTEDDARHITPIVGRPTSARFETDPDYPYQAPA